MKTLAVATLLILATTTASAALLPGDSARGQTLHGQQCTACHGSEVYTRPNRSVKSAEGLIGRVQGCVRQTGAKLDRDQVNDVVKYLDESFYKFK
jgi:mono/diheme cytochrome c family protein